MTGRLQQRVEKLEAGTGAGFTLEIAVLASYGDERALTVVRRVHEDYCAGRLRGRELRFYSLLLKVAAASAERGTRH